MSEKKTQILCFVCFFGLFVVVGKRFNDDKQVFSIDVSMKYCAKASSQ